MKKPLPHYSQPEPAVGNNQRENLFGRRVRIIEVGRLKFAEFVLQIIQYFSFFYEIALRLVRLEQQPQTGNVEVLLPDTFRGDQLRYELV